MTMYYEENINIYMDAQFWEDHADKMDKKSFYKVILQLNIRPYVSWSYYYGKEYDEVVDSNIIVCKRASTFSELRNTLHSEEISCMSQRVLEARTTLNFIKNRETSRLPIFLKGKIFTLPNKN